MRSAACGAPHGAVQVLVDANTSVGVQDNSGMTPLHLAARYGRDDAFKVLLDINQLSSWEKIARFR